MFWALGRLCLSSHLTSHWLRQILVVVAFAITKATSSAISIDLWEPRMSRPSESPFYKHQVAKGILLEFLVHLRRTDDDHLEVGPHSLHHPPCLSITNWPSPTHRLSPLKLQFFEATVKRDCCHCSQDLPSPSSSKTQLNPFVSVRLVRQTEKFNQLCLYSWNINLFEVLNNRTWPLAWNKVRKSI